MLITTLFSLAFLAQAQIEDHSVSHSGCAVVKRPPANAVCNKAGTLKRPDKLPARAAAACSTLSECRAKCHSDPKCASFGFDSKTATACTFYSKSLSKQAFHKEKSSHAVFSDRSCYKCTGCAATLLNGNFDSSRTSPWVVDGSPGVSSRIVSPGAHKSKHAISFTVPPAPPGGQTLVFLYQNFTWCSNTNYYMEFDYKLLVGTTNNYFHGSIGQASGPNAGSNVYEFENVNPGQWYHAQTAMYPTSSKYGYVSFEGFSTANASQTFVVDNVIVRISNE